MNESTYIITHIPKTAGTSLRVHFQTHLTDQVEFIHLANRGHNKANRMAMVPFQHRDSQSRNQAKVIFGHQVNKNTKNLITGKSIIEVVIFRKPKAWEISRFNQYAHSVSREQNLDLSFAEWSDASKTKKLHSQFDWFLEKYHQTKVSTMPADQRDQLLFESLSHFKHIFFVEDFPDCLKPILDDLNVSNSLTKNTNVVGLDKPNLYESNESNEQLLIDLCKRDVATYDLLYSKFGLRRP